MGFAEDSDDTTPVGSLGLLDQVAINIRPLCLAHLVNYNADLSYSGQNGGATISPSRYIMAFPNDGYSWGNLFSGSANAEPSFPLDIEINGVTQEYRVNVSNFNTNYNSAGATVTLICLVET